MQYLEDFEVGQLITLPTYRVQAQGIIDFAREFDPQPFHVDPTSEEARKLGGLMASGWHTAAIAMRMKVDAYLHKTATLTSPGVENLRWLSPVRAGDVLSGVEEVTRVRRSRSQPDRGVLSTQVRLFNQAATLVMSLQANVFVMARAAHEPIKPL